MSYGVQGTGPSPESRDNLGYNPSSHVSSKKSQEVAAKGQLKGVPIKPAKDTSSRVPRPRSESNTNPKTTNVEEKNVVDPVAELSDETEKLKEEVSAIESLASADKAELKSPNGKKLKPEFAAWFQSRGKAFQKLASYTELPEIVTNFTPVQLLYQSLVTASEGVELLPEFLVEQFDLIATGALAGFELLEIPAILGETAAIIYKKMIVSEAKELVNALKAENQQQTDPEIKKAVEAQITSLDKWIKKTEGKITEEALAHGAKSLHAVPCIIRCAWRLSAEISKVASSILGIFMFIGAAAMATYNLYRATKNRETHIDFTNKLHEKVNGPSQNFVEFKTWFLGVVNSEKTLEEKLKELASIYSLEGKEQGKELSAEKIQKLKHEILNLNQTELDELTDKVVAKDLLVTEDKDKLKDSKNTEIDPVLRLFAHYSFRKESKEQVERKMALQGLKSLLQEKGVQEKKFYDFKQYATLFEYVSTITLATMGIITLGLTIGGIVVGAALLGTPGAGLGVLWLGLLVGGLYYLRKHKPNLFKSLFSLTPLQVGAKQIKLTYYQYRKLRNEAKLQENILKMQKLLLDGNDKEESEYVSRHKEIVKKLVEIEKKIEGAQKELEEKMGELDQLRIKDFMQEVKLETIVKSPKAAEVEVLAQTEHYRDRLSESEMVKKGMNREQIEAEQKKYVEETRLLEEGEQISEEQRVARSKFKKGIAFPATHENYDFIHELVEGLTKGVDKLDEETTNYLKLVGITPLKEVNEQMRNKLKYDLRALFAKDDQSFVSVMSA